MIRKRYVADATGDYLIDPADMCECGAPSVEPRNERGYIRLCAMCLAERAEDEYYGDCISCDGYVLDEAEAPLCPTCAREKREAK